MIHFLVRRVLLGAFVMFCVTVIVYLIFYVGPGLGFVRVPLPVARHRRRLWP